MEDKQIKAIIKSVFKDYAPKFDPETESMTIREDELVSILKDIKHIEISKPKMKVGDIVTTLETGKLGIIIAKYSNQEEHTGTWDWELMCLKGTFPNHCKQDCFKEEDLKPYKWQNYPVLSSD